MGRRLTGCEGTHGVFPACDFACSPCYHSADANQVRVDGPHIVAEVDRQMAHLRARPACVQHSVLDPGENAQLVQLLPRRPRRAATG